MRAAADLSAQAIRTTIAALHDQYGAARIAITQREVFSSNRHAWQAYLFEASTNELHHGGKHTVEVVDRAGGGDAFAAGLLHALIDGVPARDAVRFATAAGALKLTISGDMNRVGVVDVETIVARLV